MINAHHERFLYGTIVTTALVTYLWHVDKDAWSALLLLVGTTVIIAVTEAYVEIIDYKITNRRPIDREELRKIVDIEFDALLPLLWLVPIFLAAYFEWLSLNNAYLAALGAALFVLFAFGYHYGTVTGRGKIKRIFFGLANLMVGALIIAVRYFLK